MFSRTSLRRLLATGLALGVLAAVAPEGDATTPDLGT